MGRKVERQTDIEIDGWMVRRTGGWEDKQSDRQTGGWIMYGIMLHISTCFDLP